MGVQHLGGTLRMYGLKERKNTSPVMSQKTRLVARRRRQLYPFFFHMGPVALCITSVLLIGLMAVLYLSQVSQAVSANQQLLAINAQQAAQKLGLVPASPGAVQVLVVKHLLPFTNNEQGFQP